MGRSGNQTEMEADGLSLGQEYRPRQEVHLGSFLYQSTVITHQDIVHVTLIYW